MPLCLRDPIQERGALPGQWGPLGPLQLLAAVPELAPLKEGAQGSVNGCYPQWGKHIFCFLYPQDEFPGQEQWSWQGKGWP